MDSKNLEGVYQEQLEALNKVEVLEKKRSRMFLYGKLLFFFGAVVMAYYGYIHHNGLEYGAALGFLVIYIFALALDDKCIAKIRKIRALQRVCKGEISALQGDFSSFEGGAAYVDPHHEYSYDLDLFGEKSLFQRINRTVTSIGERRLAEKLQKLSNSREEISGYQEAIHELSQMPGWRAQFLSLPFVHNTSEELSALIRKESYSQFLLHSVLPYILVAVTMLVLLLAIFSIIPWSFFFLMFTVQIGLTFSLGRISSKVGQRTEQLHKEFKGYLAILELLENRKFHSRILSRIQTRLFGKKNSAQALRRLSLILNLFNQRSNEIMYVFLNGMFLFDVFLVRVFNRWMESYLSEVKLWLAEVAEADALVSLGDYAYNHPQNAVATLLEEGSDIVVKGVGMYHPFLRYEKAVPNDFELRKSNVTIVTGANMAGKSTFLRTLGVSFVMACNGIPVCATSFQFSVVSLFSSMRTADDLSKDISYFNAELLRLQQLVRFVKQQPFTLIILDEILKGTNSRDKLKGSVMFLKEISKCNVSVMVATHDLELSKLEEQYPGTYQNYCFEIDLSDTVQYSYKIKRGVAQNLNASYLLSNILKEIQ